jgi:hypothetical protein
MELLQASYYLLSLRFLDAPSTLFSNILNVWQTQLQTQTTQNISQKLQFCTF